MIQSDQTAADKRNKPMHLERNQRLGKYRLVSRLGIGGYCEVWKARDTVEGIWVALKIPQPDDYGLRDNQGLLREVRLVSRLRHPNIMPVKNADMISGCALLATEISVKTLEDCSRPMAARRIIAIITEVLRGLAYAHSKRVVHCDVTPGNIFLLTDGTAAIGDFGIGMQVQGRMKTIDDFGTPGYVSPEQAYGRPTYRSDCFAVALILYEYLTGYLPRWPFKWPLRGEDRLRNKTHAGFVQFMKKALAVDPNRRFANAGRMLMSMQESLPRLLRARQTDKTQLHMPRRLNWQKMRTQAFLKRYGKVLANRHECVDCGEPIDESMLICPWCGSERNRFDERTNLNYVCMRCHKGLAGQWRYCPWCFGTGSKPDTEVRDRINYHSNCRHCGGRIGRFMRYCPWCRRKVRKSWVVSPFPERCTRCGWSVDSNFWNFCPWCKQQLIS